MTLMLASASPRRAELLRAAGFQFEIQPANVDESLQSGESADHYVQRVAMSKMCAVAPSARGRVVVGADTAVVIDGQILGKPSSPADAERMLRRLANRWHEVLTAVAIGAGDVRRTSVEVTRVQFAPLTNEEVRWYVASGEPMDKAGAYAVQGLGSRFVARIEGSYSNVVGLPIALLYRMLAELRVD